MHEASLYEQNCFLTLTYDNEHLPRDHSLDITHFQKFMKRLRKKYPQRIRFYHCGEYGEGNGRPHYHALLFNHDFADKTLWQKTTNGDLLFRSESLERLWPLGLSTIGTVTFESAAYVARYIMKKQTGPNSIDHYTWVDEHGEVHQLRPEYTTMSRRPGIGADWLKKFKGDVYPDDVVVLDNKKYRPPRAYDAHHEVMAPEDHKKLKRRRKRQSFKHKENNTPDRLKVREKVQLARMKKLKREIQ